MNKPYSESCEQNKQAILEVIKPLLDDVKHLLEIGSGTGQHAIYFAQQLSHLTWQTSDCESYLNGIKAWIDDSDTSNVKPPFVLNVSTSDWPDIDIDAVFTANSVHIMSDDDVANMIEGVGRLLTKGNKFIIYGPFNYDGRYTSESNQRFDVWLKARDEKSSIKDFEKMVSLADENAMRLVEDYAMPANNRILYFEKV